MIQYIRNGLVLTPEGHFQAADLSLREGLIAQVDLTDTQSSKFLKSPLESPEATAADWLDATGCYVIPGLIDLHVHGCAGADFSSGDTAAIQIMADALARCGVTSFLGTSVAATEAQLQSVITAANRYTEKAQSPMSQLIGLRLEGPFLSAEKKGAQNADALILPDAELIKRLSQASCLPIRMIDLAPELPGAIDLITQISHSIIVSLGHTTADYETAMKAFMAGARHVTHLFNAMPPFLHRDPGLIGAASDSPATVEVICDGVHLHPAVVRTVYNWFGAERVVLVSDAMAACSMPDGEYRLGDLTVQIQQEKATLPDGTIAGSVTDLLADVRKAVAFGIPIADAVRSATVLAARVIGLDQKIGSIEPGFQADLLILDSKLQIKYVVINGQRVV